MARGRCCLLFSVLVFWSFLDVLEVSRGGMIASYPRQTANELRNGDREQSVAENLEPTDICLSFHVSTVCCCMEQMNARLGSGLDHVEIVSAIGSVLIPDSIPD